MSLREELKRNVEEFKRAEEERKEQEFQERLKECKEVIEGIEEEMKQAYCRNHYGSEFIVMIEGANRPTTLYRTTDGFWVDEKRKIYSVVAWQPLPKPFQTKE